MFDLIDDLNASHWEDKGSPPDDLQTIRKMIFSYLLIFFFLIFVVVDVNIFSRPCLYQNNLRRFFTAIIV